MEKIIVLGTGSGITINCYSLSALLENTEGNYLLIDTGSGNQILNHLKMKNIAINSVPCSKNVYSRIKNLDWVLHEAMCLEKDKEKVKPHEKNHSTVKDVAITMNNLNVKNLLLWHCIDSDIENRKELFTKEAKEYFQGNVCVPNNLDEIEL